MNADEKCCSRCRDVKPITDFHVHNAIQGRRRAYCKECHNKGNSVWAQDNKEKVSANNRAWANKHHAEIEEKRKAKADLNRARAASWYLSNKERALRSSAEYQKKNALKIKEYSSQWRELNVDRKRANDKAYQQANREAVTANNAAHRSRKRMAYGRFTGEQIAKLFDRQRGHCAICQYPLPKSFHRDHVIPLILGGTNDISNIQLLCRRCNCSKGGKDPIRHAQELGRLV